MSVLRKSMLTGLVGAAIALAAPAAAQTGWNAVQNDPAKPAAKPAPDVKPGAEAKPGAAPAKPGQARANPAPTDPAKTQAAPDQAKAQQPPGMDRNHDGGLDRAEMRRTREQAFVRMDADKDGKLTRAELELVRDSLMGAWNARNPGGDPAKRPPPLDVDYFIKLNDRNKDGAVTLAEFLVVVDDRFAQFDVNKDGRITKEEVQAAQKLQQR